MNNEKKFIEYRPGYVTGFENKEYQVSAIAEVFEIPFVKHFSEKSKFYSYAASVYTGKSIEDYKVTLMALYDWNEEYNGCSSWWVVGYLPGFILYETKLKNYEDLICNHKPNCWNIKYQGNKHLFGNDRPEESRMKIAKELGWYRDDFFGIAAYCDCGFEKIKSL